MSACQEVPRDEHGARTYHYLRIASLIREVLDRQGQHCAAQSVHVGLLLGNVRLDLARAGETIARSSLQNLVLGVSRALRQNHSDDDLFVLSSLRHFESLDKRDLQDVGVGAGRCLAQISGELIVPANAKAVIPAPEDWESRTKLQGSFPLGGLSRPVTARRDIANVIDEVRIDRTRLEGILEFTDRRRRQLLVAGQSPLHARELFREHRGIVAEPVPLFRRQVPAPVRDLQVPLQQGCGNNGFGEFVAHGDGVSRPCSDRGRIVGTVSVGGALTLGIGTRLQAGSGCVVRHIGIGEFNFGLLSHRLICRRRISGERIGEILLVSLADGGGAWSERVEDEV